MADFGYTPEIGQATGFNAKIGVKSPLAGLASDIGNLLTAKQASDVRVQKREAKYLEDAKKEDLNEAQLHLMDEQDKLYEKYNTTADPEKRNQFVQEFEDSVDGVGRWYGLDGDNLTTFAKSKSSITNKLRLYNSNVIGKVNDKVNVSKAGTADFASMDVANTKDMDATVINNNKDFLINTEFGGDKAKYFDAKFTDFGVRLKESVAESTSVEEIDVLLNNLDVFAKDKLGDTVSVNNKDVTVDSTMYNGYHKNRQYLLEKRATAVTKLKASLPQHIKGRNKKAYMETVERVDKVGGYENPDLKQSAIDAWDLTTKKANTAKINALKKQPEYVNGYADPSLIESTYKAHGGTDEQFVIDYKAKHAFTQNYLTSPINADLSANPTQAKIVAEDVVKKLVLSGDITSAVELAGKTGVGGVLKSFTTSALGEEDPKTLTGNVQKVLEGYYSNQSVMSNNMEKDDKSAMFFYAYQMRNGGALSEAHIDRVKQGNAEGIVQKAGQEFNDEFAGKSNYTENIGIYSALVKYGVPPQTAVDYIKEDTEAHIVNVSSGLFSSMDVDLRGAPNGVNTYDSDQLEEVLSPLVDKVNEIGVEGDKKLVYDKSTGDFRLYVDEVPMQDMAVNLDDLIKLEQKERLAEEKTPWAVTTRKVADYWDTFVTGVGESIKQGIDNFDKARHEHMKHEVTTKMIRPSSNKAMKAEAVTKDYGIREDGTPKASGWLGELPMQDGSGKVMTEFSIGVEIDGKETLIPSIVPTLTTDEVRHLTSGGDTTDAIVEKAVQHARQRIVKGLSPFKEDTTESNVESSPEFVEETMKMALNSRANATALFNKDGINDYVNYLNSSFSTWLTQPLGVSNNGKVIIEGEDPVDITNPDGRKELEQVVKARQAVENRQTLTYNENMSKEEVMALQTKIGTTPDGAFGKKSKEALQRYNAPDLSVTPLPQLQEKYSDKNLNWKDIGKGKVNTITGLSGTIAHRNNNPGAMKLEFAGAILGSTISSSKMRSRNTAIKKAKKLYDGVITLDRAGFIVFDSVESGRSAQIELLTRAHKARTIEQMLPQYAIPDGSGATHHEEYAKAIYKYASSKGVNLKGKKIGDMSKQEIQTLTRAMAKVEGGS